MKLLGNKWACLFCTLLALQVLVAPVWANPCALPHLSGFSEGIGGTGKKPVSQDGLGGTGRTDRRDGIGGTGHSEGMGGTGLPVAKATYQVIGVVTGFASVCVNGFEIHFNQATQVAIDGNLSSIDALRVGQVVQIQANEVLGQLVARDMQVRHELVGPVTLIDSVTQVAEVMGQRLQLNERMAGLGMLQLIPGASVRVSGFRNQQDEILVTRLESALEGEATIHHSTGMQGLSGGIVSVQGVVKDADESRLTLVGWSGLSMSVDTVHDKNIQTGDVVQLIVDNQADKGPGIIDVEVIEQEDLYQRAGYSVVDYLGNTQNQRSQRDAEESEDHSQSSHSLLQTDEGAEIDDETPELPEADEYREPEHEVSELPEAPEYEAPELPEAPEYEAPELPEAPEYEAPELPEAPEYEAPELPEAPEYEVPELPEAPEYEAPELPEAPEYEAPELPEAPEYEAPELPEAPEYEAPELPEAPEYEAPELPEAPEYEAPELLEAPEYEAPELPEAPEYEAPELPDAPEYEAPELPEAPEYEPPELPE